jgi:hypothetical protein
MDAPEPQQDTSSAESGTRGKVLWFPRRAVVTSPPEKYEVYARKRVTNLAELLFTLVFFDLVALITAVNEFLFHGATAIGIAAAFFVIILSALADWIFVLLRRELRKRKQDREIQMTAPRQKY